VLSKAHISSGDIFLQHKTNWRDLYEGEYGKAREAGYDEVVFLNERGELTEGSRTNIFAATESGEMVTPPLSSGLLNGCLRQELLENGHCRERLLYPADLKNAKKLYLGNSLRGLIPAEVAQSSIDAMIEPGSAGDRGFVI
jgi:branched-subunit amino acid aminotransferase/4-amino-4-deoxychorismate lyase